MALTYGFFNSYKGDRKYNAEQISEIFDGILKDGIIPSIGNLFAVTTANNGMQINVGTGRAWFDHTWTKNDSVMVLDVPASDVSRDRYDMVVIEVNHNDDIRANAIKVIQGEAAVNPVKPTYLNTDKVKQYPLAYILVKAGSETVIADNIENHVGLTPTVFATGVLESASLDDLWAQWDGQFNTWFSAIKLQLSGDIVSNLQLQIDQLGERVDALEIEVKPSTATKQQYGLSANADMTELFDNIYKRFRMIMLNKALVTIVVKTTRGNPLVNIPINNLLNEDNTVCRTNSSGVASGFATEGTSVTFGITGYADIVDYTRAYKVVKGETYSYTWTVSTRNYLSLDASTNVKFSRNVQSVSYSVTGSGASGSRGSASEFSAKGGKGGNAGQSITSNMSNFAPETSYSCSIGGSGGNSNFNGTTATGGNSYTGNGIGGAETEYASDSIARNGNPGTSGREYRYSAYNTKTLCGGGGGGGSASFEGRNPSVGRGGSPYGGNGGLDGYGGSPASGYAGGGGGGSAWTNGDGDNLETRTGPGGAGGPGNVAFSMTLINL